jgi:energy-coupling factor transporter ATP-binding protein EcfA2
MLLKKLRYFELRGTSQFWEFDEFELQSINLIVGKNASGKTRTLNAIEGFANMLHNSSKITFGNGYYHAIFESEGKIVEMEYHVQNEIIEKEELKEDGVVFITRNADGTGKIWNSKIEKSIDFKIPVNELMSNRRDELQFPYLEKISKWASLVRRFNFTFERIKTLALVDSNSVEKKEFNLKETDKAISVFSRGLKMYGEKFVAKVIDDFNSIGYSISEISLGDLVSVKIESPIAGAKILGLRVQETDRDGLTDQHTMSAGMFRALSVVIHFVYYEFQKLDGCILIDDIGEGLDYDRATNLIKLLIRKAETSSVQLILSSNDKFVMNNTDLKYWQVIHREGGSVHFYNEKNSKQLFEDFKFTGLSNFDFFSMDFFKSEFKIEQKN